MGLVLAGMANPIGLLVLSSADMLRSVLNLFFYAILFQAIMSWFSSPYSPISQLLAKITDPIMRPLHRAIPPVSGIDISPIPAMILLQLAQILIVGPLFSRGWALAFS
jgi:YggT family protein